MLWSTQGLNAPFGARCFVTGIEAGRGKRPWLSLNAPFGARCFVTVYWGSNIRHNAES